MESATDRSPGEDADARHGQARWQMDREAREGVERGGRVAFSRRTRGGFGQDEVRGHREGGRERAMAYPKKSSSRSTKNVGIGILHASVPYVQYG